jgi:hypothetical protein
VAAAVERWGGERRLGLLIAQRLGFREGSRCPGNGVDPRRPYRPDTSRVGERAGKGLGRGLV